MKQDERPLNLGIVAHVDAGKTTLSEAMLFLAGEIRSAGRVDHGDTHFDTDAIERDRGITIFSKQARFRLPGLAVTLLDTPGHTDFSPETERSMTVMDAAVLVISGTDGVQAHTRTLWRLLDHYKVPVFLFVNKMDLAGADPDGIMKNLAECLSGSCVDMTKPDWTEEAALTDEGLLDSWTASGSLTDETLAEAFGRRAFFPVWFGSALKMEGLDALLGGIARFAPQARFGKKQGMRVYKVSRDAQGNRLTYVKVTGGKVNVRDSLTYRISRNGESVELTEKVDQIRLYTGERYVTSETADAGTVCALTGLTSTMPGMGIGAEKNVPDSLLVPVMTRRLILPQEVNPGEFYRRIQVLEEEEPALHIAWNAERQEIDLAIMGQVQTEILERRIRERFGTPVSFGRERIVFRETVSESAEGVGHFEPLRHYAEVHLLLERGERGSGVTVTSLCSGDELDTNWQRLIMSHVTEREHPGVLTGSPITDVRVTLLAGRAHLKHTEGGDFRQAAYRAIRHGLMRAKTMLLEPWYSFVMEIPQETVGKAMTELSSSFAEYGDPEYIDHGAADAVVRLEGMLPVSASTDLMSRVNAWSGGRGVLTLMPAGYRECHNAEEMIARIGYDPEADTENPTGSVFCSQGSGFYVPWDQVEKYMHIPYVYKPEKAAGEEFHEERGFLAGFLRGTAKGTAAAAGEGDGLSEIYAREFGRTRDGAVIGEDRSRKGWKRSGGTRSRTEEIRQKLDKQGRPIYPPKDTRKPLLIVDGYNMIFAWEELKALAQTDLGAARGRLLDLLSNYQGFIGTEVIVVFDAWRRDRNPETESLYHNLKVVFTRENQTADAWIERTVHQNIGKYLITVATSDAMEQLTVMRIGALRMSAAMLKEDMQRVAGEAGF